MTVFRLERIGREWVATRYLSPLEMARNGAVNDFPTVELYGSGPTPTDAVKAAQKHRRRKLASLKRSWEAERRQASPPAPAGETSPEPHREEPPGDH
jgi:hypothetical protein